MQILPTDQPGQTKHCHYCGKEFTTDKPDKVYCSRQCKDGAYKHRRRWEQGWREPDYHKNRSR